MTTKPNKSRIFLQVFLLVLFSAITVVRFNSTAQQFLPLEWSNENGGIDNSSIAKSQEKNATTKIIIHSDNTIQAGPVGPISIPPSKMNLHYYEMWDHNTSKIDVPEKYQNPFNMTVINDETGNKRRALTSLEILQNVLHGAKYRAEFEAAEAYANGDSTIVPKCLLADVGATQELANRVVQERNKSGTTTKLRFLLPLPILNVGYPKVGSSTLRDFFNCLGMDANHGQIGQNMFKRLAEGRKLYPNEADAYTQLDFNTVTGFYPQIQLLDELHEKDPNSTLVINFRPFHDWIASIKKWHQMKIRMSRFLMPGLVMDDVQLAYAKGLSEGTKKEILSKELKVSNAQLAKWWCGHALHIREYAKEYPSHSLIELDLYDTNGTTSLLYDLFQADANNYLDSLRKDYEELPVQSKQCWGHANKSTDQLKTKQKAPPMDASKRNEGRKKKYKSRKKKHESKKKKK